ncbi:MAG TPA: hypothetical protein PKO15_06015 [Fibrobacteria bacterium]|nr:hypothetical protein [Fibrobacteria bacterium]
MATSSHSSLLGVFVTLGLFLGGGILGAMLGQWIAPDSTVAVLVGFAMLPVAFLVGMQLWLGAAMIAWLVRVLRSRSRSSASLRSMPSKTSRGSHTGSFVFVPVFVVFTTPAGLLTGWLSDTVGFASVLAVYIGVGMVFGTVVWQLAKRGYVEFLEEA